MKAMASGILFLPCRKALVYMRQKSLRSRRPQSIKSLITALIRAILCLGTVWDSGTGCEIIKADPLGSGCAITETGKIGKVHAVLISQTVSFSGSLHVSPLKKKSAFALAEFANCISVFNLRCIRSYNKKRPQRKEINES